MKTYFDCFPCFLQQALRTCRFLGLEDTNTRRVLDSVADTLKQIPMDNCPPEIGRHVYRIIREVTGKTDPYKSIKEESTSRALALYEDLRQTMLNAKDPLAAGIKIATAGNVIDYGVKSSHAIEEEAENILEEEFAVFDIDKFTRQIQGADRIVYIGDNAGECVFDRLLIEVLNKPVTYVVRDFPIINDATAEDAVSAGIDKVADIFSSGTDAPGTVLDTCSEEFLQFFEKPYLKISKGQGNYEALSNQNQPIFFLLKAKCSVVARDLDVRLGEMVFKGIKV